MVEIKRLSYFIQVAEDRSLSKASESLCIAQPALSRQIHLLEEYLGFPLFIRTSRGMQLTKEGEYLRDAVHTPLRDLELAVENMRSLMARADIAEKFTVDMGIGVTPGLSLLTARPLTETFERDFSKIKLRLLEGHSDTLLNWLATGMIDFALLDTPPSDDTVSGRLLTMEDVVVVCSDKANSPKGSKLNLKKAASLPLILPNPHTGIRKIMEDEAKKYSLTLNIPHEIDLLSLQTDLIARQKGYGVMPSSQANALAKQMPLRIFTIERPALKIGVYLATRNFGDIEGSLISKIDCRIQEMIIDLAQQNYR